METTMISKFNQEERYMFKQYQRIRVPQAWAFPTEINVFEGRIWILNSHGILCVRPELNSILITIIFELILINLIMSFVFSRDDAVSNTVSRPVVARKLGLATHLGQNEG